MTAPMPKYNEVDEKVMPVAWRYWNATPASHVNILGPGQYEYIDAGKWHPDRAEPLYSAATVAELRAEVERLRTDAYKLRRLAQLLDGFDFRLGRNALMPPATYLDSVEITCEFQPGIGQSVIDAIVDVLATEKRND